MPATKYRGTSGVDSFPNLKYLLAPLKRRTNLENLDDFSS